MPKLKLTVVVPVFNEEQVIGHFRKQWNDGTANRDHSDVFASHLQQHAQYFRAAQEIKQLVRNNHVIGQALLIQVNINLFTESLSKVETLHYINGLKFHAPYLTVS